MRKRAETLLVAPSGERAGGQAAGRQRSELRSRPEFYFWSGTGHYNSKWKLRLRLEGLGITIQE